MAVNVLLLALVGLGEDGRLTQDHAHAIVIVAYGEAVPDNNLVELERMRIIDSRDRRIRCCGELLGESTHRSFLKLRRAFVSDASSRVRTKRASELSARSDVLETYVWSVISI